MLYSDEYGWKKGTVDSDETIRDEYVRSIGKIDRDATIWDEYGRSIGSASEMSKDKAAYEFFFK